MYEILNCGRTSDKHIALWAVSNITACKGFIKDVISMSGGTFIDRVLNLTRAPSADVMKQACYVITNIILISEE